MGEILEIKCHNCSANKKVFVGGGMEFSVTKLYHCPLCDFIKSKTFYDESNPFNVDYKENITIKFEDLIICLYSPLIKNSSSNLLVCKLP